MFRKSLLISLSAMAMIFAARAAPVAPSDRLVPSIQPPRAALSDGDLVPQNENDKDALLRALAFQATIYGMSAYLQYEQMYRQAIDKDGQYYTGFNNFYHERKLAGPGYKDFKVPNADTLYSTAWIDLTRSPVELTIPPADLKYYTLNFFDMFGNPSNLGTRTIGSKGGRFLLVPPGWEGDVPDSFSLYRAGTPHLWVLMRVFAQNETEIAIAQSFQDAVVLKARHAAKLSLRPEIDAPRPETGAIGFLRVLDYILRVDGCLPGEAALVHQFQSLGISGNKPFDPAKLDDRAKRAIDTGYEQAMSLISGSKTQLGVPTGTGWMRVDKGKYGFNYIRRAVINAAGLGANVPEENSSFTTFIDGHGAPLDGSKGSYTLKLRTPPPVSAFWSVTLYDGKTFELYPNAIGRYLVSDRTKGLKIASDGSITITIQHAKRDDPNWIPAPAGPFFLVIRSYLPKPPMLNGAWLPEPIHYQSVQGVAGSVDP